VDPGVLSKTLSSETAEPAPKSTLRPEINAEKKQATSALGAEASRIKFKLQGIVLKGNKTFTDKELSALYQNKLGQIISVAELEAIVSSITNYYTNQGYVLSSAFLPPQHIKNGIVHIQIIEGFIENVKILGSPRGTEKILMAYGKQIALSKPVKLSIMEHYIRLANEIPGLTVRMVLEPSQSKKGASDLNFIAEEKKLGGYLSYDNYGTLYIGPNQVTANVSANSILRSGDTSRLTIIRTSRPLQLQYADFTHETFLGGKGLRLTLEGNNSNTRPGLNLAPLKVNGDAVNLYALLAYPLIRSRTQELSLDGGFNFTDSTVVFLANQPLYTDHIRSLTFGGNYNFADRFKGSNLLSLHVEKGLKILGATSSVTSSQTSRYGANGDFFKVSLQANRLQQLYGRYSLYLYGTGQYSFAPLLASEQFAFGGSQVGRAYDAAEIIGDRGVGGTLELRANFAPDLRVLKTLQPYLFYDAGVIWNIQNLPNVSQKQSITSTGFGVRITFTQNIFGNLMITQPLTKVISAENLRGNGRRPRGFFSITAMI